MPVSVTVHVFILVHVYVHVHVFIPVPVETCHMTLTCGAKCEVVAALGVELDTADVGLRLQRRHRVLHVGVPQLH